MRSKKALYNIITNFALQLVVILYGLIIPKLIISNFGSSVNGLISSISQFLGYITLLEAGFGPVVKSILYKPLSQNDSKTICDILKTTEKFFKKISIIFLIYILFLSILYPLIINSEFNYLYTMSLIIIISLSTFAEYFFGITYSIYLQSTQKNYIISFIQIITYIMCITIIVVLIKCGVSIQIVKLVTALIFILRPICQRIYVFKKCNLNLKDANDNYSIKNKWDGLAQHIAWVIHNNTDVVILTFFCTLGEISVYSVYLLIVRGVKNLIQSFSSGIDSLFGNMIVNDENKNLNKKFNMYETMYFTITTIIFSCTLVLIVPFVSVYTKNIIDVDYIRYSFGYLIVISEYLWAIRLPYTSMTLSVGHFKETRKGAWVEVISNILISLILVNKLGIIGVAIGTVVAMGIRTIEFLYHTNKFILNRSIFYSLKKIFIIIIETLIVFAIYNVMSLKNCESYIDWIFNSSITFIISSFIIISINSVIYIKDYKEFINIFKSIFKRKKA